MTFQAYGLYDLSDIFHGPAFLHFYRYQIEAD